ncbi:MAG: Iron-sulfur flavoprotein [Methanoregula sp. PtaU1.Bin051]|nr:MAG: Iron-sulfur flavoprotein [Methanoregula sp. PtaU1.Bin051]
MEQILSREIKAGTRFFTLTVDKEDLSEIYPGFFRYTLAVRSGDAAIALFRTNTYEYAPGVPLRAEEVTLEKADRWEKDLQANADEFLSGLKSELKTPVQIPHVDVVIVQASPRADGNSSTLAQWAEVAAREAGMEVDVIYPHDMDIHECIGCYQCFNAGTCIYDDDMIGIIAQVNSCRLLIICTPVYTNTVPGNLKLMIDRFQEYFAAQSLDLAQTGKTKGIILSVAGRPGQENFTCIKKVLTSFMNIAGIRPAGDVFIDGVDRVHDIREIEGLRERVQALVENCLKS